MKTKLLTLVLFLLVVIAAAAALEAATIRPEAPAAIKHPNKRNALLHDVSEVNKSQSDLMAARLPVTYFSG